MVDLVSESEQIEEDERTMLHSVFELGRTLTREVMVPRTDMITVTLDTPLEKALALFVAPASPGCRSSGTAWMTCGACST